MTDDNVNDYSNCILECLNDKNAMNEMSKEAFSTAETVSVENMVSNFVSGIKKILF